MLNRMCTVFGVVTNELYRQKVYGFSDNLDWNNHEFKNDSITDSVILARSALKGNVTIGIIKILKI